MNKTLFWVNCGPICMIERSPIRIIDQSLLEFAQVKRHRQRIMERAAVPIEVALQPSCLECVFPIGPSHMDQLSRAGTAQRSPIATPPASPLQISSFRLRPYMVADFLQLAWEHRLLARGWCELSRACSLTISELVGQWQSVACEIRACLFAPSRDAVRALLPCLLMVPSTAYDCLCVRTYGISAPVVELFLHHAAKNGNLAVSARKELDSALKCVPASVCIWEAHHFSNKRPCRSALAWAGRNECTCSACSSHDNAGYHCLLPREDRFGHSICCDHPHGVERFIILGWCELRRGDGVRNGSMIMYSDTSRLRTESYSANWRRGPHEGRPIFVRHRGGAHPTRTGRWNAEEDEEARRDFRTTARVDPGVFKS